RFQLIQRRQIRVPPEEADRDDLAPQTTLLAGVITVDRVMTHLFDLAGPLLEKFMGVVVVVRHAGTERVDQGKASVLHAAFDQLDQLLLLAGESPGDVRRPGRNGQGDRVDGVFDARSEEHTSELQSRGHLVCRLLLEKKKYNF